MSGSIILHDNEWNSEGIGASEWKLTEMNLNTARCGCASVSFDNYIYTIGGYNRDQLPSVEKFDTISNHRSILPSMNCKRDRCAGVIVENKIYAIGGWDGNQHLASIEMMELNEETEWINLSPMKNKRSGCVAVSLNHLIYIIGGSDGKECLSSVEVFDTRTSKWSELAPMTIGRYYPSAAVAEDCIFVMGGRDNHRSTLSSMASYNMKTKKWNSSLPSMMTQRLGGSCVSLSNNSFIVMGGQSLISCISNVEAYHIRHKKWTPLPEMTIKRGFLSGVMVDGNVYAIGGCDDGWNDLDSIEKMEMKGLKKNTPPPPPSFPPPPIEFQSTKRIEALQVYVSELEKINEQYLDNCNKKKDHCLGRVQKEIDYHQDIIRKRKEYQNDLESEFERVISSWKSDFAENLEEAKSQIALLKLGDEKKQSDIPNHLLCPLTLDIMKDPVIASDGFIYEREAIERLLNSSNNPKSPMTNEPFANHNLIQNNVLRSLGREYSSK